MQIVYFRKGRDGDPIARYEGKIAFPDRRSRVEIGQPYVVQEAHPNPKETVFFLRVEPLDLEAVARKGEGPEYMEYTPPRKEAAEVETPKGLCRAYIEGDTVRTEVYPWGKAYQTVWLNPPAEALPGIEVPYLKKALAPAGEEPRWVLAVPRVKEPDRYPVLEEKMDPQEMQKYQERLAAPLRTREEHFQVGRVRVALPEVQGLEIAGTRVTGWSDPNRVNPTPCDSVWVSVERTLEPNLKDWRALSHRVHHYSEQEENTAHYGSETWGTGTYSWVERERHEYVLEHLRTGQILTRSFPHALEGVPLAPPSEQARLTPELWASGLRQEPRNYLPMEENPVLSADSPLGRVELAPRVEDDRLLVPRFGHPPFWEAAGEGATVTWRSRVETSIGEGLAHLSGKLAFPEGRLVIEEPSVDRLELKSPPPMDRVTPAKPDYEPRLLRLQDEPVTFRAVLAPQDLEVRALDPVGQEIEFRQTVKEPTRPDPDGLFTVRVSWEGVYKSNLEEFEVVGRESRHDLEGLRGVGPGGDRNHVWTTEEVLVLCHKESGETLKLSARDLPQDFLERGAGDRELER